MAKVERASVYFSKPGSKNTADVIEAVARRVKEGDIKTVVLASTSGQTGVEFADALKGRAEVVVVSHEKMDPKLKARIVELGAVAADQTHLPLHAKGMDDIRNALYTLGQGFKVAVEVILIATDNGLIQPGTDVIGVAGSGAGADTAIVARSTKTKEIFSRDRNKKLEVREITAMPSAKKWWD